MLDYVTNFTKKPAPGPYLGFGRAHFILTKGGSGLLGLPGYNMLYSVEVATTAATGKLVIYNGTDATGDVVATIDITTKGSNKYAGLYCPAGLYVEIDTGSSTCSVSIIYDAANPKVLTVSGNEITDAIRDSAPYWTTTQAGDMVDATTAPGGYGIHRLANNLFRRGQCDGGIGTDIAQAGGGTSGTIGIDVTVPPPFSQQSFKATTVGDAAGQGIYLLSNTGQAAATGTNGVGSVMFKGQPGNTYGVRLAWANVDTTVTFGPQATFVATGGWQLLGGPGVAPLAPVQVAASETGNTLRIRVDVGSGTSRADTFWVAHGMLESGQSVVAPYVATTGGNNATHFAARVLAPVSVVSPSKSWVAARVRFGLDPTLNGYVTGDGPTVASLGDNSGECFRMFYRAADSSWRTRAAHSGSSTGDATIASTGPVSGTLATVLFSWSATQVAVSVNGSAFTFATPSAMPVMAAPTFEMGTALFAASAFEGDIVWLACGKGSLTDGDAATINGFGSTCPKFTSFPDAALATLIWPCVTTDYLTPF